MKLIFKQMAPIELREFGESKQLNGTDTKTKRGYSFYSKYKN